MIYLHGKPAVSGCISAWRPGSARFGGHRRQRAFQNPGDSRAMAVGLLYCRPFEGIGDAAWRCQPSLLSSWPFLGGYAGASLCRPASRRCAAAPSRLLPAPHGRFCRTNYRPPSEKSFGGRRGPVSRAFAHSLIALSAKQRRTLIRVGPFGRKGRRRRSPVSPGAGKYRCRRLCVHLGRSRNTAQCGRILAGFTEDLLSGLCASWRTGPPSFGWSADSPAEHTNPLSVGSISLLRPHTFSGAGCRRILLSGRSKNPVRRAGHPLTLQRPWLIVIPAYHEGVFREWIHFAAYIILERFPQYRFRRQCRLRQIRKIFFAHFPFKAHAAPFAGPSDPAKEWGRRNNGHSFFAL